MRTKRSSSPGGVRERDTLLIGSSWGVAAVVSVALRLVLLALERALAVGVTELLVLAHTGVAGYGLATFAWVAGRGASMAPRAWILVSHCTGAVAMALCALAPDGGRWTVLALTGAGGLAGAGVAIAQLVRANVLERVGDPDARKSAVARVHAWMLWVSAGTTIAVGVLAEHSWRVALAAIAVTQGAVALAHVRLLRLPQPATRRARGFAALRRLEVRRALRALAGAFGCTAVMHGLLAVLLAARGLGPLAVALFTVGPVLLVAGFVHRLAGRTGVAGAALTALCGYVALAVSSAVHGNVGLALLAVAVTACQLGGHLMIVGIHAVLAAQTSAEQLTGSIVSSLAVAGVGVGVAACYDQVSRSGVGLPGIAATLAALALPLIASAAWCWTRSLTAAEKS